MGSAVVWLSGRIKDVKCNTEGGARSGHCSCQVFSALFRQGECLPQAGSSILAVGLDIGRGGEILPKDLRECMQQPGVTATSGSSAYTFDRPRPAWELPASIMACALWRMHWSCVWFLMSLYPCQCPTLSLMTRMPILSLKCLGGDSEFR